jgi:predicted nucleic acid-binding protein
MPDNRFNAVVDTNVWIALLEDEEGRAEDVVRLIERAEAGEIRVLVSTITITEVVKGPTVTDPVLTEAQERTFVDFMDNPFVTLVSVDPLVASRARNLRKAIPRLKTPDAIIIATAGVAGAEILYTYDDDLLRLHQDPTIGTLRVLIPPDEARQLDLGIQDGEPPFMPGSG